ncbi:MAG: lyase family protein, partial [Desulfarculaceae bacterium]
MSGDQKKSKLWGGRFKEPMHELMERINASIGFDQRLAAQDIRASQAHARMLARQGILPPEDAQAIVKGLDQVLEEIRAGEVEFNLSQEDIHTHVEARLKEIIGQPAAKLHTARSRNDQVATDLRLWVMESASELDQALLEYQRSL